MMTRRILTAVALAAILTMTVSPAEAGKRQRARRAARQPVAYYQPAPMANPYYQAATQTMPVAAPVQTTTGDPRGEFVAWLNGVRGQHGLPAVGYDPSLEPYAADNNAHCSLRGLGHWAVNLGWWSCASGPLAPTAMFTPLSEACASWMSSAPHRSTLLNPAITAVGIATNGTYWTVNSR